MNVEKEQHEYKQLYMFVNDDVKWKHQLVSGNANGFLIERYKTTEWRDVWRGATSDVVLDEEKKNHLDVEL